MKKYDCLLEGEGWETKKRLRHVRFLLICYFCLIIVMFLLPFFSVEEYSIVKNTTSHLGAQHAPNAWIMNAVFFLLGLASLWEGWLSLKKYWVQKVLISIFGVSFILMTFFQHAPIVAGISYSEREDVIHSVLASTIGFTFTVFAISAAFIDTSKKQRLLAFAIGIFATLLSMAMALFPDFSGIWQRMIFIFSFGWLAYFFAGIEDNQ